MARSRSERRRSHVSLLAHFLQRSSLATTTPAPPITSSVYDLAWRLYYAHARVSENGRVPATCPNTQGQGMCTGMTVYKDGNTYTDSNTVNLHEVSCGYGMTRGLTSCLLFVHYLVSYIMYRLYAALVLCNAMLYAWDLEKRSTPA